MAAKKLNPQGKSFVSLAALSASFLNVCVVLAVNLALADLCP